MQITVSMRRGLLSPEMEQYVHKKCSRLTRIFQRIEQIEVTVDTCSDDVCVELIVHAEHKSDIVSRTEASDFFAAVDAAVHKMEEQLRRYKERIQQHRGRTPASGQNPRD